MSGRGEAVPFRWDVSRREQLGRLLEAELPPVPPWHSGRGMIGLLPELRPCAAGVVARAGDARLVFVGRSLENVFDYLSGILSDTEWPGRCELLLVSLRKNDDRGSNAARAQLRAQLAAVGLAPDDPFPHYAEARVHLEAERWDDAMRAAQQAIRIDSDDAGHYVVLSAAHLGRRRWREALDAADDALALDPTHT
ncbi:tetratricopeptide repeat protein, partial [Longimicrobium sp.]|uniref:tetratricopeptide repeat protein n=1 Tax=Longimicrobium sp. TaxID=2029185 RepID=UPI002F9500DD